MNGGLRTRHENVISCNLQSSSQGEFVRAMRGVESAAIRALISLNVLEWRVIVPSAWCGLCASGLPLLEKVLEIDQLASL